jgi:hypothetical protein
MHKNTYTYLIIPNDSCNSFEYKKAGVNCLMDKVTNYAIYPERKSE